MRILRVLLWIPALAIKLVLAIIGLIVVPIALRFEEWPKVLWLWGNDESGPLPGISPFVWYAIRNPVNNARFLFKDREAKIETNWDLDVSMEATEMLAAGQRSAYLWAEAGWMAGYRKVWLVDNKRYSEIWFGWKLASGVPGLGFTSQVRLRRPIGQ